MSKHINLTSKTYYSRNKVNTSYNQWNYYLSQNIYPVAIYFAYASDSNSIIHQVRQQLIHVGGKGYAGPAGKKLYVHTGAEWAFLTKGHIFSLFFPTWTIFTQFMLGEWGKKLSVKLPVITVSIQGNYVNLNHKVGLQQLLQISHNYLVDMHAIIQHFHTVTTTVIANVCSTIYYVIWMLSYMVICLVVVIHSLTHHITWSQDYPCTLLTTTSDIPT